VEDPADIGTSTPSERRVYANRTLNLRSIKAIGYDMDYTLVHYRVDEWERMAFEHARRALAARGWPVDELTFEVGSVIQGLVVDLELGNLVKATRFGYVIRAHHGGRPLSFEEQRDVYATSFVDLNSSRWYFLNTLFSLSEASLFAQLVASFDQGQLSGVRTYRDVYNVLRQALDEAHTQGELKARIIADPAHFVELDPELGPTLLDQLQAGKTLMLITNSEWAYTKAMMAYALQPYLPEGVSWRDLFRFVVVNANKPSFFSGRHAAYRMVDEDRGLLAPHSGALEPGVIHAGGDAITVENTLGLYGAEILYVGDHLFGDVHVSKSMLRWRTGLIMRELEGEIAATVRFEPSERKLVELMNTKTSLDSKLARVRLARQRARQSGHGPKEADVLDSEMRELVRQSSTLDAEIAPLARTASELGNAVWGPMMRAGVDKSLFARQVERHADVYTSRVSNFGFETPFGYLRASRSNLPHDPI
jgi:5'-nucleotidase